MANDNQDSKLVNRHKRMAMGKQIETMKKGGLKGAKHHAAKKTHKSGHKGK
jgi:hypothetical protein